MIKSACLCCLFLALPTNADSRAQDAEEPELVHVDEAFGFRIARPDTNWMFVPRPGERSVDFSLVLTEPALLARVSVRVNLETTATDPLGVRASKLKVLSGEANVTDLMGIDVELGFAEEAVPGVSLIAEGQGVKYRVRQFFLSAAGRRFELEDVIVLSEVEELAGTIDAIWAGFRVTEATGISMEELRLSELAAKCGSEVKLAEDWKDASARARKEGKLVAVAIHLLPGFDIENSWVAGSFMDPDLVDLLNERYVPVLFRWGWNAPFEAQSSYGMGPNSFGTTMLLVTPDGEVVDEGWVPVEDLLLAGLERMPGTELKWAADSPSDPLDRAELLLRRGEYARALALLKSADSARGHLLLAQLHRRERHAEAWGAEVEAARAARDAAKYDAEIDLAEALFALRMGRTEEALGRYRAFLEEHADSPLAPEATFRLGQAELAIEGQDAARERWSKLADEHPESRWSWKAAHTLLSNVFKLGESELLAWPAPEVIESLLHPESEPWEPKDATRARKQAIDFLLATQADDGSWICPADIGSLARDKPRNLTEAVTAICARSLLPFRDREPVKRAVDRALLHLIETLEKDLEREPEVQYMDYTVWNRASQVYFFSECLQLELGDRGRVEEALSGALKDLRERQHERGGWSYFISGTFGEGDNPITQSISFVTAYVALGLAEARDAGALLPEGLAPDALDCLERMRNENGTFTYMLHHQDESAGRISSWPGSAGRGPLCALALLRHERGSLEELRMNFERYAEHHLGLSKQLGRALMHAGPYAEGSHWILFDYATAAEALTLLPRSERGKHRALILADVLEAHRADGSYLDNQLIGRALGTGMALLAFESLDRAR